MNEMFISIPETLYIIENIGLDSRENWRSIKINLVKMFLIMKYTDFLQLMRILCAKVK